MNDDHQPRENDALVEPMFEALGEVAEEEDPEPESSAAQRGAIRGRSCLGRLGLFVFLTLLFWIVHELNSWIANEFSGY